MDGSANDMKTSEGLSLPPSPCSHLGGQWLIKINEKLGRQALKLTLMCQIVSLKFVATVVFTHCWESASAVNFLNSRSMQANKD